MKRICLLAVALLVAAFVVLPVPRPGALGGYNALSGLFWCSSRAACIHEIAHKLDVESGRPSQSQAFGDALNIHLAVAFHGESPDRLSMQMLRDVTGRPDGFPVKQELYADLFMSADGQSANMPADLRPFYDWPRADDYMRRYGLR